MLKFPASDIVVVDNQSIDGLNYASLIGQGAILILDKPLEWTSHDLVKIVKNQLRLKVGHAGTLDPLATGIVIVGTGKSTKALDIFQGQDKVYTGHIAIGAITPTCDLESEPTDFLDYSHITQADLETVALKLTGQLSQFPPIHSAIKVDGKRMYDYARQGLDVEIKARPVEVFEFEIVSYQAPLVEFRIHCSKGTYIRSLARDFGALLGVGGYLQSLRRVRNGIYEASQAIDLEQLKRYIAAVKESGITLGEPKPTPSAKKARRTLE